MRKKRYSKIISMILAASMTTMALAGTGCSSSSSTPSTTGAPSLADSQAASQAEGNPENAPIDKITMLVNYKAVEAPSEDNPLLTAIKDYTGTTLDVMWVPQDAFEEKINTMMASSALPDVTVIRSVKSSGFVNAARAGMFWDLAPYISQYKNLSAIDENVMKNVQTDGKQFLIPRIRDTARMGGIIRTDWLENLGMEMPTTLEELYDILYAFTYNDPDGNGIDDTIGVSMSDSELKNVSTLLSIYSGGDNTWTIDENGKFIPEYYSQTYTDALTWFRTCYENGMVNKDFPINADELTNFTSGKAGMMWLGNLEDATTRMNNLTEINPDATVDVFQILTTEADGDPHIYGFCGYTGAIAIPKTQVKDEAHLLQVLDFLDKLGDPEMCDLFNWGVEGDSYDVVNGKVTQTAEQMTVYATKYNQLRQITPFYTFQNLTAENLEPLAKKVKELMTENVKYTVFDPTLPYISETAVELAEVSTFIQDAATQYVIGELDLAGWEAAIQTYMDRGGSKIAEEYAAQYNAAQ